MTLIEVNDNKLSLIL